MPKLAWDALEAGYDGLAIRRMGSFDRPTGFETDAVLPAFMKEIGMILLPKEEASLRAAYDLARDILETRKNPIDYAADFHRLWVEADYMSALNDLGQWPDRIYLSSTYGAESDAEIRQDLLDHLILFSRNYSNMLTE